jgi:hypothetical protein
MATKRRPVNSANKSKTVAKNNEPKQQRSPESTAGVFERTGLVLQAGMNLIVYSSAASVGCTVYGIETSTT